MSKIPSRLRGLPLSTLFIILAAALILLAPGLLSSSRPPARQQSRDSVKDETVPARQAQHLSAAPSTGIPVTGIPATVVPVTGIPAASRGLISTDNRLWRESGQTGDKQAILQAINGSLRYLSTRRAATDYRRQAATTGITRAHVRRSLLRFRRLLQAARSAAELRTFLRREFLLFRSTGRDGAGEVHFTAYFEPTYSASRTRNAIYRYPLYRRPSRFSTWSRPHPTRAALEGITGLTPSHHLRGQELVWLRDRLEAYLVHVEGSARLKLTDGKVMSIGYADHTNWPYTSVGRELVKDGKIRFEELTQPALVEYFRAAPDELNRYLPRNRRFVFFRETRGAPASGSLGVSLTAERSITTDKSLMPPGAPALINVQIANPEAARVLNSRQLTRFVLDQDTGGAITGAGRVDIFMGTGQWAGARAGVINSMGQLSYLLLKKGAPRQTPGKSHFVVMPFP